MALIQGKLVSLYNLIGCQFCLFYVLPYFLFVLVFDSFLFYEVIQKDGPKVENTPEEEPNMQKVAGLLRPGNWAVGQLHRGAVADLGQG